MESFQSNLRGLLEAKPNKTLRERRLLTALGDPKPNKLQRARIALAEEHAKAKLGFAASDDVDWSTVKAADWKTILPELIAFIMKLLALFA